MVDVRSITTRVWTRIVEFDVERSFTCGAAEHMAAQDVILGAGWTLFTLDFKRDCAVFLRIPPETDLPRVPFVYNAQFELATHVACVAFGELLAVVERLPDIPKLIQFFSMGHCGSTLLHHVFNRVPGVVCISEPISFNSLALNSAGVEPSLKQHLARAALRLLARFPGAQKSDWLVVKHFSQSTTQFKLLVDAQPHGKNLFLYRDALGWANSFYHFVQNYGTAMEIARDQRSLLWRILSGGLPETVLDGILDLHGERLTFDALAAVGWSCHVQQYQRAMRDGISLYPLRYNELVSQRASTLVQLFHHLGLPESAVAQTLSVFDRDAHEGTRSARSSKDLHFTDENYATVRAVLAHLQIGLAPDLVLPAV